jgi:hypothetical protein
VGHAGGFSRRGQAAGADDFEKDLKIIPVHQPDSRSFWTSRQDKSKLGIRNGKRQTLERIDKEFIALKKLIRAFASL